jgi:phage tail sheath gpL-like
VRYPRSLVPLTLALAAAAGLLSLSACGSSRTSHAEQVLGFHQARLVIDDPGADLRVVPGAGPGLRVQRWVSGTAAQPGHATWALAGDTLRLSVDCTGLVFHCGARFQVAVPARLPVVIDGGGGSVQLRALSGPVQVSTAAGDITASALRSPTVRVTSSQGDADVGFAAAPRFVDISCTSGNATVRVPVTGHRYHVVVTPGTGSARTRVRDYRLSRSVVRVMTSNGSALVLPEF